MDENFAKPFEIGELEGGSAQNANALERAIPQSEPNGFVRNRVIEKPPRTGEGVMQKGYLLNIPVNVQVVLGTTRMALSKVMALGPGSIVALDKELSEPVILLVNGNEVAKGLIVVVNETTGQLGISLTEIVSGNSNENPLRPV